MPDSVIDAHRLLADLHALRGFGAYRTGVHRPTYSPIDMQSRRWLAGRMEAAGLTAEIDGIGNVFGRAPGEGPRLLLGSHSDTQPQAGWLDGALGVIAGLEVARALPGSADVVAWADEEGHYASFPGSRSFIGDFSEADIDAARNRYDATPMRDALAAAGLGGRARAGFVPGRHSGYIEVHIEQGDELEARRLKLGVVTTIVGVWQYRLTFEGVQNHAGTTRMAVRRDAGRALVRLADAIDRRFPAAAGERTVWTAGRFTLEPGAASVIPGRAEMLFQFRDADPATLERLEAVLKELVAASNAGPCATTLDTVSRSMPRQMDARLQEALEGAAERVAPGLHQRMPSGAGHDAQQLARVMPAAMLFIPSIGGISHHWAEDSAEDDIVLGCRALAGAVASLTATA